jgi:hypothetical protein
VTAYAKSQGIMIVDEFYYAAVSGADPIEARPGFLGLLDMLASIARNGGRARVALLCARMRPLREVEYHEM